MRARLANLQYLTPLRDPCRTNLVDCSVATRIGAFLVRRVHAASALELFLVSPV